MYTKETRKIFIYEEEVYNICCKVQLHRRVNLYTRVNFTDIRYVNISTLGTLKNSRILLVNPKKLQSHVNRQ